VRIERKKQIMADDHLKDSVNASLKKILAEIEAYRVLPNPGTPEAVAMGNDWDAVFDEITKKRQEAVNLTLLLLPPDVSEVVDAIHDAAFYRQQGIKRGK